MELPVRVYRMTDGEPSRGTDDALPTDGAPEETEETGSETGTETAEDSSGGGPDDTLPTDNVASETDKDETDDEGDSEDGGDLDDESDSEDAEEPGGSPGRGFTPGSSDEDDDASGGSTETTDDTGEVLIEEESSADPSVGRSKGLAELDRELETMDSETDRADSDLGATIGRESSGAGGDVSPNRRGTEVENEVSEWGTNAGQAETQYCPECGSSISRNAEICPECGVRQPNDSSDDVDPATAALLSFVVPGLGDFYSEETELGAIMFLAWIAWLAIGWGLVGGGFTLITFGFGLFLVLPVLLTAELFIHIAAAVISYFAAS